METNKSQTNNSIPSAVNTPPGTGDADTSHMEKPSGKKKDRGKLLTTLLILGVFFSLFDVARLPNTQDVILLYGHVPPGYMVWNIFDFIAGVGLLTGIWFWRKFAVYLYFILVALEIIVNNIIFQPPKLPPVGTIVFLWFLGFIPVLLYFWAIKRKWAYFE